VKRASSKRFDFTILDLRPIVVALAGPNGAGKTTFYYSHLRHCGLRFINADILARELQLDPYAAAEAAAALREELVRQRESFIFETVFSDPVGDKVRFLKAAGAVGYVVLLCFIGISGPGISEQRVAMRMSQGGHEVPRDKLIARYPRTIENLARAARELPLVMAFDNDDLRRPFRHVATYESGQRIFSNPRLPPWLP